MVRPGESWEDALDSITEDVMESLRGALNGHVRPQMPTGILEAMLSIANGFERLTKAYKAAEIAAVRCENRLNALDYAINAATERIDGLEEALADESPPPYALAIAVHEGAAITINGGTISDEAPGDE